MRNLCAVLTALFFVLFPPLDVIRAITVNAAAMLGWQDPLSQA
jgi:imidazolonepropionase-like amidohydrolase